MLPTNIIIHHSLTKDSGTVSWGPIRKYHVNMWGWKDIGYHIGIELVGDRYEVLLGRMPNEQGAHTKGMNTSSIGICCVGNFDTAPPTKALLDVLRRVCLYFMSVYGIPPENVYGHREYASYKTCPGKMFSMNQFRKSLVGV